MQLLVSKHLPPIVLFAALMGCPVTALAAPGDTLYVRGNNVNVRTAPRLTATVMMQVHYGYVVIEIQRREAWVNVSLPRTQGKTGWIHASLLRRVTSHSGPLRQPRPSSLALIALIPEQDGAHPPTLRLAPPRHRLRPPTQPPVQHQPSSTPHQV